MRTILAALLGWLWLCSALAEASTAVWIDTDPSLGAPWREVDDAFALVLAFASPELEIVGLSTSYGNASLPRTTAVARDLVWRFGGAQLTERAVSPGADAPNSQARKTAATTALADALRKQRLTYIALGPLTNLAHFLELHPDLAPRIDRIIFIGGRSPGERFAFGPQKTFAIHDANVFKDPAAAARVLRAGRPVLLVPVEIAPQLALNARDYRVLEQGGAAGRYLAARTRIWRWFWTGFVGETGGLAFDLLGILPAVRPTAVRSEARFVTFAPNGDLVATRTPTSGSRRVQFLTGVKPSGKVLVVERLAK